MIVAWIACIAFIAGLHFSFIVLFQAKRSINKMAIFDENWSSELLTLGAKLAEPMLEIENDLDAEKSLIYVDSFEYVFSLIMKLGDAAEASLPPRPQRTSNKVKNSKHREATNRVLRVVSNKWLDDRKVKLIEHLSANGYFSAEKEPFNITPASVFIFLKITAFPPALFLLVDPFTNWTVFKKFVKNWKKEEQESLMLFLENYLSFTMDERSAMLESYPFYSPCVSKSLVMHDKNIEKLLLAIAEATHIPPTDEYFARQVSNDSLNCFHRHVSLLPISLTSP